MKLRKENGFITEFLTIFIVLLIIVLCVILIQGINQDSDVQPGEQIASAKEYYENEVKNDNVLQNNTSINDNFEATNETASSGSLDVIIKEFEDDKNTINTNQVTSNINNNDTNSSEPNYNKYYYSQLNDYAKTIYDIIFNNKENLKLGKYKMNIPDHVTDVLYETNGKEVLSNSFQDAIDAVKIDNPELFYISFSKILLMTQTTTIGNDVTYKLSLENDENSTFYSAGFSQESEIKNATIQLENKKREILSNAYGNDYDKVKYIHDWLVNNVEYDTTTNKANSHNIYGALIENEAVCDGYARAFKYLLDAIDIPCVVVQGKATNSEGNSENHAWNYVKINRNWYAVDVTWDDPIIEGWSMFEPKNDYTYLLKGSEFMSQNHTEDSRISEGGKEFKYPRLNSSDF